MTSKPRVGLPRVCTIISLRPLTNEHALDLVPLMKRLENYQKPCNNNTHGYDGPIAISNGGQIMPVAQDFLRAAHAIGVPYSDDIQGLYPVYVI